MHQALQTAVPFGAPAAVGEVNVPLLLLGVAPLGALALLFLGHSEIVRRNVEKQLAHSAVS